MPFSEVSSQPRDQTQVPCTASSLPSKPPEKPSIKRDRYKMCLLVGAKAKLRNCKTRSQLSTDVS